MCLHGARAADPHSSQASHGQRRGHKNSFYSQINFIIYTGDQEDEGRREVRQKVCPAAALLVADKWCVSNTFI